MFRTIKTEELRENPFRLIGKEWMLVSAVNDNAKCNMMTASWGGLGILWNKPAATIYIRPTRYTDGLIDKQEFFALSFFGDNKAVHKVCGHESGRDTDKLTKSGLTAILADNTVYFEEAELVLICRKMYKSVIDPQGFVDKDTEKNYPLKDYHNIYIGEIIKVLVKPDRLGE